MKNVLLICPYSIQKNLLEHYRHDDAFSNVKCLSKEELFNDKFGHYSSKAVVYLMKKTNCTYEKARVLLKYARFVLNDSKDEKLHELYLLRNELLENNLLFANPYFENILKNKEIHIYGYSKRDRELSLILENYSPEYHSNKNEKCGGVIYKNLTLDDEILYMLNNISELIDQEISPNDIYILCNDELALYYIEKHHDSFGFKVNFVDGPDLFSTGLVSEFINKYKEDKDLEKAIEWLNDLSSSLAPELIRLIRENSHPELTFEQQLDYLKNVFKKKVIAPLRYENAVNVISEPIEAENAHIFVPVFVQGQYPISFKDNEYLNDKQLAEVGMNTSLEKGQINEDVMMSFFGLNANFYFSYSDHSFKENYYASPWIKSLGLLEGVLKLPIKIYSDYMGLFLYGKSQDSLHDFKEITTEYVSLCDYYDEGIYRNFNNQYTGVDAYDSESDLTYSYTSIKAYYQCPFSYYLGHVLKLDPFEGNFGSNKGNVAHSVLQHMYDKDFDFDTNFDKEVAARNWTAKEKILLTNFKKQVKLAVDAALLHSNSYMENAKILREKEIKIDIAPKAHLKGFVDKAIIIDNQYLFVVDYKTGNENFEPKYLQFGYSMQLPTYAYLASKFDEFKDLDVCGMYINAITDSALKIKLSEEDFIPPYLKLNGQTIDDSEIIKKFDTTFENGKSKFVSGLTTLKNGGFTKKAKIANRDEFNRYIDMVNGLYMEANLLIKSNNFEIHPKYKDDKDYACRFCPFADICYRTIDQIDHIKLPEELEEEGSNDGEC